MRPDAAKPTQVLISWSRNPACPAFTSWNRARSNRVQDPLGDPASVPSAAEVLQGLRGPAGLAR
ncbi:hypothetical protein OH786_16540 [Streptomyces atratus]|uniref:hypothetical protein n=1 Tax=Streptomyces atratus TaxID=1893 RepID=UPI0032568F3B